ncbi:hypothetical protein [Lysinibacillus sp. G4S2]|uniref:hypothetical protein n=1 Tax=Lysinibacillus sp. G4S2 TaxID=3055859 RepID=UPI0025A3079B|nr:hypothetical protein [Lysinibacillus sp. G4S2]MDM5246121.1 hypothetical protein [Lysinibacillus sp. G4S2]
MATYSNMQLGTFAVNAITTAAICHPLMPDIPAGDKGISFDGHIDVMKDASERKDAFLGKVPVQVKRTGVKHFSGLYITSGAVLFVVEVDDKTNTKIFYRPTITLRAEDDN